MCLMSYWPIIFIIRVSLVILTILLVEIKGKNVWITDNIVGFGLRYLTPHSTNIAYRQTYLLLKLKLDTKINSIVVWWCLMPMACYSFFLSILNWRSRLSGRFLCVLENKRRIIGCLVEICFIMSLYFSISYFYHDQAHYHPFQNHYNFFYIAFEVDTDYITRWDQREKCLNYR
jgi:hypothetical protein